MDLRSYTPLTLITFIYIAFLSFTLASDEASPLSLSLNSSTLPPPLILQKFVFRHSSSFACTDNAMRYPFIVAALLATTSSVIADEVVVWTTVVEWVGANGSPVADSNGAGVDAVQHANNPVPTTTAAAAAPHINEKLALPGGGEQSAQGGDGPGVQNQVINTPSSTPTSSTPPPPPAATSQSSSGGSGGGGGGFESGTCTGDGMNIFWTGDEVDYSVMELGTVNVQKTGTTKGCLNLGDFHSNMYIGGMNGTFFEGNWNAAGPIPLTYFDISYIPGFSVPVLCKSSKGMSGCSIDLHAQGNKCPIPGGDKLCNNPTGIFGDKQPGAPNTEDPSAIPWCYACAAPDPFFQPCAGSAYTFPNDDDATITAFPEETITCCVGTSCGKTGREGKTKGGTAGVVRSPMCNACPGNLESKRDVKAIMQQEPQTPSLLPRKHKRHQHQHRHAAVHEANK